jgi:hypothetical protein
MRRVLLLHLDGKLPNLALMRIAHHHRALGNDVVLRRAGNAAAIEPRFDDPAWDHVYASAIFERTRPLAERVRALYPGAVVGGTGTWNMAQTLESIGVASEGPVDYSDYPRWQQSIGFTMRGCRMKCEFCVVPKKEGRARAVATIDEIWRGEGHPRWLVLLDNDFFGNPLSDKIVEAIIDGKFKVNFCQGINARMLSEPAAAAVASLDYRDTNMKTRRIYTAWDSKEDERVLFRGLEALVRYGVRPRHIMVYILIGYWPGETHEDRDHRRRRLREFGALPYPMPFRRTPELVGFQRWVIGAYDKRIPWNDWAGARFSPRQLGHRGTLPLFPG